MADLLLVSGIGCVALCMVHIIVVCRKYAIIMLQQQSRYNWCIYLHHYTAVLCCWDTCIPD